MKTRVTLNLKVPLSYIYYYLGRTHAIKNNIVIIRSTQQKLYFNKNRSSNTTITPAFNI